MLPRDNGDDLGMQLAGYRRVPANDSDYIGYSLLLAVAGAGLILAVVFAVF